MKPWLANLLRKQWFCLLLVVILLSIITGVARPLYLLPSNIASILKYISVLGLVATGATILIVSGNFDISVGAVVGLTACVMAMLMQRGVPVACAVAAGLGLAVACSLFVGGASILLRAPSFIVSLACITIFRGIAQALTNSSTQTIPPEADIPAETTILAVIPVLFLISLVGFGVMHFLLTYTKLGRRVYSIGSNPRAAYLSGIGVRRNKLIFFAINGLYVGIAAALLLFRFGRVTPMTGNGYELRAIGAVVIGGAPMSGGKGKIIGTFFGVLLMGVISSVLNMFQVDSNFQDVAFGLLIIVALAVSLLSQRSRGLTADRL